MTSATDSDRPAWAGRPAKPVSPATDDGNEPQRLLLTAEEAAQVLGVGRTTVYGLLRTGQLDSVRIGSARRVSVQAIEEFVKRLTGRIPPPPDAAVQQNERHRRSSRRPRQAATTCEALRLPFAGGDDRAERT